MSLLNDLLEEARNAAGFGAGKGHRQKAASGRIERLCHELSWSIDERNNDGIVLEFNDPLFNSRTVMVKEMTELAFLLTTCKAILPASCLPFEVMGYLLTRNTQLAYGAWRAPVTDNHGKVSFTLAYCALIAGLNAATFRLICKNLLKEAQYFDFKMKNDGLLWRYPDRQKRSQSH